MHRFIRFFLQVWICILPLQKKSATMILNKNKTVHFVKMHGVGNDYIFVDTSLYHISDPSAAAIAWSRSHFGIGSDGLVLIDRPPISDADFSMRIFNADGSEGMMCGNATRCIGKYVYECGMTDKTTIKLQTASGIRTLHLTIGLNGLVASVKVDMDAPILENKSLFRPDIAPLPDGVFVSMGNPHFVTFVDDINTVDVAEKGSALECNSCFPHRCNIEFAQVLDNGIIRMRVWERGSGITMACGTGACATAVASALTGHSGRQSRIVMDGGTLDVTWSEQDGHVYLDGPAAIVFEGDVELP